MQMHALREWWWLTRDPHRRRVRPRAARRWHAAPPCTAAETLEDRTLLSTFSSVSSIEPLDSTTITGSTAEKPQSKVWEHAGTWWSVFGNDAGTHLFRLDETAWTNVLTLSTRLKTRADVVVRGDVAHVLMEKGKYTELASIEYMASAGTYDFWSGRPDLVRVPLEGVEAATIDVDTTGRMWLASDNGSLIEARHSDAPYADWSGPITIASGVNDDDIGAVVAFGGQIGVLWSNQNTQRFGFRVHLDGDDPLVWSDDEVPAGHSALDVGSGMADDHINLAAASDGTLYAAVKTGYNQSPAPQLGLLVRRPDASWDPLYEVDREGTRPIVHLNEEAGSLFVIYRAQDNSGPIVLRESSISTISFGEPMTVLSGTTLNNPSGTKQNTTGELVVIAAGDGELASARLVFGAAVNRTPVVDAGAADTAAVQHPLLLDGTVLDDGLPNPPGAVTTLWTLVSGPGSVVFADPAAVDTTATFDTVGTYELRLTADDSELTAFDHVTVTVVDSSTPLTLMLRDGIDGYAGTTDTRIRAAEPDRNLGRSDRLQADGSPDAATLLRWDVSGIPAGSRIESASITLFVLDSSRHTFELYQVLRPWTEREATFNHASAGTAWEIAGAQGPNDRGSAVLGEINASGLGTLTFELNAAGLQAVADWVNDPSGNFGLLMMDYDDASFDNAAFRARNTPTINERPALTISYVLPGAESSTALAASTATLDPAGSNDATQVTTEAEGDPARLASPVPGAFLAPRRELAGAFPPPAADAEAARALSAALLAGLEDRPRPAAGARLDDVAGAGPPRGIGRALPDFLRPEPAESGLPEDAAALDEVFAELGLLDAM